MIGSLRTRLMATLLPITGLAWLTMAVVGYHESYHEIEEIFDAEMAQIGKLLVGIARHGAPISGVDGIDDLPYHEYESKLSYAAWRADGSRILAAGDTALVDHMPTDHGYGIVYLGLQQWRTLTLRSDDVVVRVAEQSGARDEYAQDVAQRLLLPLIAAAPLLIAAILFSVGHSLRPIERIAAAVSERHPTDLHPINDESPLRETKPLVTALNSLLRRLEFAFHAERRFTADAAHELQTPLAGLSAQYEIATRAVVPQIRDHALGRIGMAIDHMTALVRQLLALARCDALNHDAATSSIDVAALVDDTIREFTELAHTKNANISVATQDALTVQGSPVMVTLIIRNLLDNALRYGPTPARIHIALEAKNGGVSLRVADNGPGVPVTEREHVFQRFYRCHANDVPGTGLGLCIVRRCAEWHHGHVTIGDSAWGGLEVEVWLPTTQTPK